MISLYQPFTSVGHSPSWINSRGKYYEERNNEQRNQRTIPITIITAILITIAVIVTTTITIPNPDPNHSKAPLP